ncbi:hypothetical protein EC991_003026 [Linnemannia zychae]|nr:hypothetical protein EC991_003026 [Linnemannia zychae]
MTDSDIANAFRQFLMQALEEYHSFEALLQSRMPKHRYVRGSSSAARTSGHSNDRVQHEQDRPDKQREQNEPHNNPDNLFNLNEDYNDMDDHSDLNKQLESSSSTDTDHLTDTDTDNDERGRKSAPKAKYPNGKVVETVEYFSPDDGLRAKSTGWVTLCLQSFRSLVLRDKNVKVQQRKDGLKALSSTFITILAAMKKAKRTGSVFENTPDYEERGDGYERVDIVESICLGVYYCPEPNCEYVERPRQPTSGKNRQSRPRPAKTRCGAHPTVPLAWSPCSAALVVLHYYTRMKVVIHHLGVHSHRTPPPLRESIGSRRVLTSIDAE